MLAFPQSSGWQRHDIFGSSVIVFSHFFVGIFKRNRPISLLQLRLQESPAVLHEALLAVGPVAWELTQIQLLGNHWFWLLHLPPPQSALLHSRYLDFLKVHHSLLHSEKSMNTQSCFLLRRRQRKCQVLYWWEIHNDCHWAGWTWAAGSAGATELENGPKNVLSSKKHSLVGALQMCILLSLQHFLWDLGKTFKYNWVWNASFVKESNKISPSWPAIGKLGWWSPKSLIPKPVILIQ